MRERLENRDADVQYGDYVKLWRLERTVKGAGNTVDEDGEMRAET